jgi:hypothetical protein
VGEKNWGGNHEIGESKRGKLSGISGKNN